MERDTMPSYYAWDGKDNGWDKIAEEDFGGSYEFDMLVVWRNRETGTVVYAEDSGCSCPSPFESHDPDDFKEFSMAGIEAWFDAHGSSAAEFKDELRKAGIS